MGRAWDGGNQPPDTLGKVQVPPRNKPPLDIQKNSPQSKFQNRGVCEIRCQLTKGFSFFADKGGGGQTSENLADVRISRLRFCENISRKWRNISLWKNWSGPQSGGILERFCFYSPPTPVAYPSLYSRGPNKQGWGQKLINRGCKLFPGDQIYLTSGSSGSILHAFL